MTQTLSREHRLILEKTAAQARACAESGAWKALKALAVAVKAIPPHFTDAQKKLRVQLREHGRAIGDQRDTEGKSQTIDHLITEIAYPLVGAPKAARGMMPRPQSRAPSPCFFPPSPLSTSKPPGPRRRPTALPKSASSKSTPTACASGPA
jgi:hypothetical protein